MSEEVDQLMDAFLSLCLEQRKQKLENEREEIDEMNRSENEIRAEYLKSSALELAQKLYFKAAELERLGDISKGIIYTFTFTFS